MTGYVIDGGPARPTPGDPITVARWLPRAAELAPRAGITVVDADGAETSLRYPQLLAHAQRVLSGLRARGVESGEAVIVQQPEIADYLVALWACLLGGIRPVALTTPKSYQSRDPGLDRLTSAWEVLDRPVILGDDSVRNGLGALPSDQSLSSARVVSIRDCERSAADTDISPAPSDDIAMYLLSSGSTGRAKIIPLTNRGLLELGIGARQQLGMARGDVSFNWFPLDHSGALLLYHFAPVFVAAENRHAPTEWVLAEPLRWLESLAHHRVNHSWSPNFGYRLAAQALSSAAADFDLSALKTLVSGGEQILESVMNDFLAAGADFGVTAAVLRPCWGMTETTTAIAFGSYTDGEAIPIIDERRYVSVGEPSPGARMRVVGPDGTLPERHIGRLQVCSARVTPGYVGAADQLAFGDDGWFDTGDLAWLSDGRLTITGRAKDLIILAGNNHDCHQIEEVVAAVPGVRQGLVAAVGVPDEVRGTETLAIVFVPREPATAALISSVRAALSNRLGLTAATVIGVTAAQFPRTANGKIQREVLRRRLLDRTLNETIGATSRPPSRDRNTLTRDILHAARSVLGTDIDPGTPWYEQGIDSIRLPKLANAIQRAIDMPVTTTTLLSCPTVDALVAELTPIDTPAATKHRTTPPPADRRIAIIGMAGRFPGADSIDKFWDNLSQGVDSVRTLSPEQLAAAGVDAQEYQKPDYVPATGVLGEGPPESIADFDAGLFGISAREAELTDPQQRLFLECCHQALAHAGYQGTTDHHVALYAGSGMNLYSPNTYLRRNLAGRQSDPLATMQVTMGNQPDFMATRVAYRLGLTGAAINVQTACSTGLVAVHLAISALLADDADVAIAGAAAVHVPQATGYTFVDGAMMSPSGRCRSFDADADGTVGGNGVAAVVLKRLDRALADGDTVHSVIVGSAVNNDGSDKVGFTAPSVSGQVAAITRAMATAGVGAEDIDYVEAHGTGTRLGDPLEVRALTTAFASSTGSAGGRATPHCALGSVKANIGHLDSCAGLAGLIKAVLVLRHGQVPPQINFDRLNPQINLDGGPFYISAKGTTWPELNRPRRAAVQALGVGGTNAHLILEAPPTTSRVDAGPTAPGLVLSANSPAALTALAASFAARLREGDVHPADVFTTTALGRQHYRHRMSAMGVAPQRLPDALEAFARGERSSIAHATVAAGGPGPLCFAFSGQGAVRAGFARELYEWSPAVREIVDACAARFQERFDGDLLSVLLDTANTKPIDTDVLQPALFTFQAALTGLWERLEVRPDYVVGHSVGEYAAWYAAGALSIEEGLDLTAERGRAMRHSCPPGRMIAVRADRRTVEAIRTVIGGLDLAVVNGGRDHVLAGEPDTIAEAAHLLTRREVPVRELAARQAFHSALLEGMLPQLRAAADRVRFAATTLAVASTLDGRIRPAGSLVDADYFVKQTRLTARFDLTLSALEEVGCGNFLEIGPDAVLSGIGRRNRPRGQWLSSEATRDGFLASAGRLHCEGYRLHWNPLSTGRRVPLPTYPFDRQTYWVAPVPGPPRHPRSTLP